MKKLIFLLILAITNFMSCDDKNNKLEKNHSMQKSENTTIIKTGYSDVNGIKMYFELHGNKGDYLVLIHGGGSTLETTFSKLLPFLSKNHQVIAVELQGHGHTNDRNSPESFEQDADDVAALLHNLNISKASFFGFSNGGNTAMQISFRHPELVNKLILASTFYKREGFPQGFFDGMKQATINVMPESLKSAFLKINPDTNLLLNMFNKDRERMINFKDWPDEMLSTIKTPTLIISGDHDVISLEHTVAMTRLIPKSSLMILPGSHGEYMGVAESPDSGTKILETTVGLIDEFLKK